MYKEVENKYNRIRKNLSTKPEIEMTEEEKILFVAQKILKEHKKAFQELAK